MLIENIIKQHSIEKRNLCIKNKKLRLKNLQRTVRLEFVTWNNNCKIKCLLK